MTREYVGSPHSWNSLPNSTVELPSLEGLQQFKKSTHQYTRQLGKAMNAGPASDARSQQ